MQLQHVEMQFENKINIHFKNNLKRLNKHIKIKHDTTKLPT